MTHSTVYRHTTLKVTLRHDGLFQVTTDYPEHDLTDLLTDEQKEELAAQVRRERGEE